MALAPVTAATNSKANIDTALAVCVSYDQAFYTAFVAWVDAVQPYLAAQSTVSPSYEARSVAVNAAFVALKAAVNV